MKRIAFIFHEFPGGGAEKVTIDTINQLIKTFDDYEFFIFTMRFNEDKFVGSDDGRFHIVVPQKELNERELGELITSEIEDGLRLNVAVFVNIEIDGLTEKLHESGCKTAYILHNTPFWEVFVKKMRCVSRRKKSFLKMLEYWFIQYIKINILKIPTQKFRKIYRENLIRHDAFILLCEEDKRFMYKKFGIAEEKLAVISNLVFPVEKVEFAKEKLFVYVGRLYQPSKRIDRLIKAWRIVNKELSEWDLLIVGDGPDANQIKEEAKGVERVEFLGYTTDTSSIYRRASALCMTSAIEGLPMCMIEAQANGVIPIVMDCNSAGVRSVIEPVGENGFLVPKGDVEAFAKQMIEFANLSEDEKLRLRHNVVKKSQEYSPEKIGEQWHKLFSRLLLN